MSCCGMLSWLGGRYVTLDGMSLFFTDSWRCAMVRPLVRSSGTCVLCRCRMQSCYCCAVPVTHSLSLIVCGIHCRWGTCRFIGHEYSVHVTRDLWHIHLSHVLWIIKSWRFNVLMALCWRMFNESLKSRVRRHYNRISALSAFVEASDLLAGYRYNVWIASYFAERDFCIDINHTWCL